MDPNQTKVDYSQLAREARKKILTMISKAHTSHAASNLSVIDIATVLYENLNPKDEVVWSKGWAAASVYYFLSKQGKIPYEDLDKFGQEINGEIPYLGLAETTTPGVLVNGGSVGHGLPVAVGMAYAKRLKGEEGIVYCIMSDGELNEGTTWESAMLANQLNLNNLVVFCDKNSWQAMGRTKDVINMEPLMDKWMSFGWRVLGVDGHDYEAIETVWNYDWENNYSTNGISSFEEHDIKNKPLFVICETIKGKGVSFFEDHLLYHYKHVDEDELQRALAELDA